MIDACPASAAVAAGTLFPSFAAQLLALPQVDSFHPTNPSVTLARGQIWLVVRHVNYELVYDLEDDARLELLIPAAHQGFQTRNFLHRLDHKLVSEHCAELRRPPDWPDPAYRRVQGLEDCRLFEWNDLLWCAASVRELSNDGVRRVLMGRIARPGSATPRLCERRLLPAAPAHRHQKNWIPLIDGGQLRFIRTVDPTKVVDAMGELVIQHRARFVAGALRGGSQAIPFAGGWLAAVHETVWNGMRPYYYHRFAWFDRACRLTSLTPRFVFVKPGIEFAAGLCWSGDGQSLIVSFGVDDRAAWLATVAPGEVLGALQDNVTDLVGVTTLPEDV